MEAREAKIIQTNLLTWQTDGALGEVRTLRQTTGLGFPKGLFTGVFGYMSQMKISAALNMSPMHAGSNLRLFKVTINSEGEFKIGERKDNTIMSFCFPVKKNLRLKTSISLISCNNDLTKIDVAMEEAINLANSKNLMKYISDNPQVIADIFHFDWASSCNAIVWEGVRDFGCGPVALKFCTLRDLSSVISVDPVGSSVSSPTLTLKVEG